MKKLFAKVAVQIVAVNLIWAFVGVFCAMCVSWSVVVVCMSMCMTDMHGVALCCSPGALPREIIVSNRSISQRTSSVPMERRLWLIA